MESELTKRYKSVIISWLILFGYLWIFFQGYLETWDQVIYQFLHSLTSTSVTGMMIAVTFIGSVIGVVIICLICLIADWRKGLFISMNVAFVTLCNMIIKNIIQRPRPSVTHLVIETGYSFPSAHSMVSFALFAMIAYFLWRKHKITAILIMCFPMMIGITRIYLGVHYASDVIGGFLFALAYLCLVISIFGKRSQKD